MMGVVGVTENGKVIVTAWIAQEPGLEQRNN